MLSGKGVKTGVYITSSIRHPDPFLALLSHYMDVSFGKFLAVKQLLSCLLIFTPSWYKTLLRTFYELH